MSSQLAQLVTAVAAKVADATVLFQTGKLKVDQHAQRRKAIFVRTGGLVKPSAAPGRAPFGVPVGGVGTTEYVRFTREEKIELTIGAEDEDALDLLFDKVVNAIFDVGGPNVLVETEQPYDFAGGDSEHADSYSNRNPTLFFMFRMRVASHPHTQPFAVLTTANATISEPLGSQAFVVPHP